jgi:trimethylamine--corrinoid protein Co-methyltransferase
MARFYDLPGASAAGMTGSKQPDFQSGYEKGITNVLAGLSGLDLVYEAAGMHASLLGFCLESLIIDDAVLGHCLRCQRGLDAGEAVRSVDAIAATCMNGPGHYLDNGPGSPAHAAAYFGAGAI